MVLVDLLHSPEYSSDRFDGRSFIIEACKSGALGRADPNDGALLHVDVISRMAQDLDM